MQDTSSGDDHAADKVVDLPDIRIQACTGLCQALMQSLCMQTRQRIPKFTGRAG